MTIFCFASDNLITADKFFVANFTTMNLSACRLWILVSRTFVTLNGFLSQLGHFFHRFHSIKQIFMCLFIIFHFFGPSLHFLSCFLGTHLLVSLCQYLFCRRIHPAKTTILFVEDDAKYAAADQVQNEQIAVNYQYCCCPTKHVDHIGQSQAQPSSYAFTFAFIDLLTENKCVSIHNQGSLTNNEPKAEENEQSALCIDRLLHVKPAHSYCSALCCVQYLDAHVYHQPCDLGFEAIDIEDLLCHEGYDQCDEEENNEGVTENPAAVPRALGLATPPRIELLLQSSR